MVGAVGADGDLYHRIDRLCGLAAEERSDHARVIRHWTAILELLQLAEIENAAKQAYEVAALLNRLGLSLQDEEEIEAPEVTEFRPRYMNQRSSGESNSKCRSSYTDHDLMPKESWWRRLLTRLSRRSETAGVRKKRHRRRLSKSQRQEKSAISVSDDGTETLIDIASYRQSAEKLRSTTTIEHAGQDCEDNGSQDETFGAYDFMSISFSASGSQSYESSVVVLEEEHESRRPGRVWRLLR